MIITTTKNLWICIDDVGQPDYTSLRETRRESIEACTNDWQGLKSDGWRCVKCDVEFAFKF